MFGFLRSAPDHLAWRRAYSRCCQGVRREHGLRAVPWLSYESVALYLAASDLGGIPRPPESWPTCCKLRAGRNLSSAPDAVVLRYCAAAGLLLLGVKLEDDVRDSGSWAARILRWNLRKPIRRAAMTLNGFDAGLTDRLAACVGDHLAVERTGDEASLSETVRPTAAGFGHLFAGLAGTLPLQRRAASRDALRSLGERIGAAIIRHDCAVDREADLKRGEFNPLRSPEESEAALDDAIDDLTTAAREWREFAGPQADLSRLLEHRVDAIAGLTDRTIGLDPRCRADLERAGLARAPGSVYAATNPCAIIEILECCGGIADCVSCLAPSHHDPCRRSGCGNITWCCTPCDDLCGTSNTTGGPNDDSTSPLIGMKGKCLTALKPGGMIRVAGVRRRAEAQGEHLPKGTRVVVIAAESFGLLVRRAD